MFIIVSARKYSLESLFVDIKAKLVNLLPLTVKTEYSNLYKFLYLNQYIFLFTIEINKNPFINIFNVYTNNKSIEIIFFYVSNFFGIQFNSDEMKITTRIM